MEITTNTQLFTTVVSILIVLYQNDCLAGTLILLRRLRPRLEDGAWRQTVSHGPRPLWVFCALARHLSAKQLLTSLLL
jgi:hypothetical protein